MGELPASAAALAASAAALLAARMWQRARAGAAGRVAWRWLTSVGVLLAVAGGLWVGFLLGLRKTLGRIYEPLLAALYAVPSVVWYPSLMLFFGLGPASKIAFGVLLGFFPVTLAVLAGIRQVAHDALGLA